MKVAVFVSGGGHLDEALSVLEPLKGHEWILITYQQKSLDHFQHSFFKKTYFLRLFSSWGFLLYGSLFLNAFESFWIFLRERPTVLFSTGSEIAILPFFIGKYLFGSKIIFLETVTRFEVPSRTAKWLYPISDLFLVQWKELLKPFRPKAVYVGRIL